MPPKRRGGSKNSSAPGSKTRDSNSPGSGKEWDWFEVEDILEESTYQYFVRWGARVRDPKTGNRYPDEWIPKETANDRLVADWEARKRGIPISEINPNVDITQSSQAWRNTGNSDNRSDRPQATSYQDHQPADSSPVSSSMPLSMAVDSDAPEPPNAQSIAVQVPRLSQFDARAEDYSSQVPAEYRQPEDAQPVPGSHPQDSQLHPIEQPPHHGTQDEEGFNVPSSSGHVSGTGNTADVPQADGTDQHLPGSSQVQDVDDAGFSYQQEDANLVYDSQIEEPNAEISNAASIGTNIDKLPETVEEPVEEQESLNAVEKAPSIVVSGEDTIMSEAADEVQGSLAANTPKDIGPVRDPTDATTGSETGPHSGAVGSLESNTDEHLQPAVPETSGRKRSREAEELPGSPAKRPRGEIMAASNPGSEHGATDDHDRAQQLGYQPPELSNSSLEQTFPNSTGLSSLHPAAASMPLYDSSSSRDLELALDKKVRELEKTLSIHRARLARMRKSRQATQPNANTIPSQTPHEAMPTEVTSPVLPDFVTQLPGTAGSDTQIPGLEPDEDVAMGSVSTANSGLETQITEREASFEERFQQLIAVHKTTEETLRQEVEKWKAYHAATESDYGKLVQEHLAMEQEHRGFKMNVVTLTRQNETLVEKVQSLTGVITKLKDDLKQEVSASKTKIAEALESVSSSKLPEVADMEKMRAEVEASNRRLASGQRDVEFMREQYQQASAAAVENNGIISKQEEELTRLRSKAEGEAVKLRAMFEENHIQKERDDAEKAQRRASQLEKSLRRATEEILEFKKKEAAKGMAAFTRASSNIGSRPASRAVSRRPGSPGPSQLGPSQLGPSQLGPGGSQRTKARNGTPKIG